MSVYTPLPFLITTPPPVLMTPFLASLFTVPMSSLCLGASELTKAVCTSLGGREFPGVWTT